MSETTILIVEDEAIVALDLCQQIEEMGYDVAGVAESGDDAISMATRLNPSLTLMDVSLKGKMTGIEAAASLTKKHGVPVIFLTSFSDDDTVRRAAMAEPHGYLTKPFQSRELHASIEVALYKAKMDRRLRDSERWFASTLRCVRDGIVITDDQARIRYLNPVAESLTGWGWQESMQQPLGAVVRDGDAAEMLKPGIRLGHQLRQQDDGTIQVDSSSAEVSDTEGHLLGNVLVLRDATERLRHEAELTASESRFRRVFDCAPLGMALVDIGGKLIRVNEALCNLFGYPLAELMKKPFGALSFATDEFIELEQLNHLKSGEAQVVQFEQRYRHAHPDRYFWALVNVTEFHDIDHGELLLYQIHDLTERKDAEQQLIRLAYQDPLTGLGNRAHLYQQLDKLIVSSRRNDHGFAIGFMDLDGFKHINDSLGHDVGDLLLQTIADRLRATLRESDTITRNGGDEFVFLLPEVGEAYHAVGIAEKVRLALAEPIRIADDRDIQVTTSIGISLYPDDGDQVADLLRHADTALYAAKGQGRNRIHLFQPSLAFRVWERMEVESRLRTAIEEEELFVEYQPIVNMSDSRITGFEALLRWRSGNYMIGPDMFIPVAEESNLILPIGNWVLREACRYAVTWPQPLLISVNCSAVQFRDDDIVKTVADALAESGLPPQRLCLELTEGIMLTTDDAHMQRLEALKAMGVQISIDDYGTGYSSLLYLKRYAPQSLKIDRAFVHDLEFNPNSRAIVSATVTMAHALGIRVVAEGVESQAQADYLLECGCELAQGYLYGRPLSTDAVATLFDT